MPSPVIGVRPGWGLTSGESIDRAHPLAVGLVDYILGDRPVPIDLVTGASPTLRVNPATMTPIYGGLGIDTDAGGFAWSTAAKPLVNVPLTAHAVFRRVGSGRNNLVGYGGGGAGVGWRWAEDNVGAPNSMLCTFGGVADYNITNALSGVSAGSVVRATLTISGTSAIAYLDGGRFRGTATVGTMGTGVFTGTCYGVASNGSGSWDNIMTEPIAMVAVWRRALSPAEVAVLHADPFCMLRR